MFYRGFCRATTMIYFFDGLGFRFAGARARHTVARHTVARHPTIIPVHFCLFSHQITNKT